MIPRLRLFLLFIAVLATQSLLSGQNDKACVVSIGTTTNIFDGINVQVGDTICLLAGQRSYLLLKNIQGIAQQPIVIINHNGGVIIDTDHFYGIKFSNCKHVKLIASSHATLPYGVHVQRVGNGAGITIDDLSTNIEIAYVRISNTALGGIYAKTDPDCNFNSTRDKFTMYNIRIRNCYLHDIEDEGFYIGSSKYTGQYLPGCDTTVFPHFIHGVWIHDNIVERTGWDGIQVSSAPVDCKIFNNIIRNDSYRETPNQMSGILIGGGSKCECYNNQIIDGKGDGIDAFGFGLNKIYNNLIVRAGRSYFPNNPSLARHGIFVGNAPDGAAASYQIMHNTIIGPKTTGIRFFNNNTSSNLIFNNIITNPGAFAQIAANAYFNTDAATNLFSIRNNLFTEAPVDIKFINFNADNFDLQASSPAVNKGFFAGLNAVNFDIKNRPRPHNQGYDIGAFESQDPFASLIDDDANSYKFKLHPNPASGYVFVYYNHSGGSRLNIQIRDVSGKNIATYKFTVHQNHENAHKLILENLLPGIYFVQLAWDNEQPVAIPLYIIR